MIEQLQAVFGADHGDHAVLETGAAIVGVDVDIPPVEFADRRPGRGGRGAAGSWQPASRGAVETRRALDAEAAEVGSLVGGGPVICEQNQGRRGVALDEYWHHFPPWLICRTISDGYKTGRL